MTLLAHKSPRNKWKGRRKEGVRREVVGGREERREEECREREGRKTNSSNHRRCVCESLKEWTGSDEC